MTQQDFLNCIDRILKDFHFKRKGKDYYSQGSSDLLVLSILKNHLTLQFII